MWEGSRDEENGGRDGHWDVRRTWGVGRWVSIEVWGLPTASLAECECRGAQVKGGNSWSAGRGVVTGRGRGLFLF